MKVINAGYSCTWLSGQEVGCQYVSDFQAMVRSRLVYFATLLQEGEEFQFGHIQHGHGAKGKQFSIVDDQDVCSMYSEYRGRKEIVLWMKIDVPSQSRSSASLKRQKSADS